MAVPLFERVEDHERGAEIRTVGREENRLPGHAQGMRDTRNLLKMLAVDNSIEVLQPEKAGSSILEKRLREIFPDIIVVAAYGCILKENILDMPPNGCINVHASLLPKYRGASPVPAAIKAGEKETGVTLQYMARECDAGDIILQEKTPVESTDTTGKLLKRLAGLGAEAIVEILDRLEDHQANLYKLL